MWGSIKRSKGFPAAWKDFQKFIDDLGDQPSEDHVLRRKNSKEPHSKSNTYWTKPKSQKQIPKNADDTPVPYSLLLRPSTLNGLQKLANRFKCLAERGKYSSEPSIMCLMREIGDGEFIIERKVKKK